MYRRLDKLYQSTGPSVHLQPDLLPTAFQELGTASEELQVALEELHQQSEELADVRVAVEVERQHYQELFEFAPSGYLLTDAYGTIREANRAAATLLNVEQRFLVGKPLLIFVAEAQRQILRFQITQLQQAEQVQEWVLCLCPRRNEPFNAVLKVAKICDWEGKIVGLRICIRELNGDNRSEAGLEKNGYNPIQNRTRHVYLKGEIIPLKPEIIWQVCYGVAKLSTVSENGSEVLVGLAGPSMAFGSNLTLLQTYQATALVETQLVCFSLTEIAAFPGLAQTLMAQINQRLKQTELLLAISVHRHVPDRLHHLLLLLKQEIGQPVEQGTRLSVRLTHQDLAEACSTTRVTITRLLGKLQQQGRVILDSNNHIILTEIPCTARR